jgi:transposase
VIAIEQDAEARQAWWATTTAFDPAQLLFLDETSTPTTLTPLRARSPRGTRATGRVPRRRWQNVTLLATMTPDGIGESVVIDGSTNRKVFDAFVEQRLVPALRPGQIVILDNLSAHKSAAAQAAIEAAGCQWCFLPSYSPDFNPIELAFSKIKQQLRRAEPRSYDEILAATKTAVNAVTRADAHHYFQHVGYALPEPPGQPL